MKNFFRRWKEKVRKLGYLRFNLCRRMKSFDCPEGRFSNRESGIRIKGLKPFIVKKIPEGEIKEIRLVGTARRMNVQFVNKQEVNVTPSIADFVGIDLVVTNLATFSNVKKINGRNLKLAKQKARQRELNLKSCKGTNGETRDHCKAKHCYRLSRALIAKVFQTLREQVLGSRHWLTSKIVQEHPNLVVEQLQILNMVKNHKLARSILEQRWATFVRMLEYKAERAGSRVVKVNPANTSRMCSRCSSVKAVLLLSERVYSCSNCDIEIDCDINAARNMLRLAQTMSSAGISAGEFGNEGKEIDGIGLWEGVV